VSITFHALLVITVVDTAFANYCKHVTFWIMDQKNTLELVDKFKLCHLVTVYHFCLIFRM